MTNYLKYDFFNGHVYNTHTFKSMLCMADVETIVHAYVTSCVGHCKTPYSGLPASGKKSLQLVQNPYLN